MPPTNSFHAPPIDSTMAGPNVSATTSIRNDHTAATRKYHAAMFSDTSEVSDCMV